MARPAWWSKTRGLPAATHASWLSSMREVPGRPTRVLAWAEAAEGHDRRIATVSPDSFRDARGIGELFRDGIPVIVNLTAMDPSDAKRVVDFAAGLIFGLRGSIDRVANRVFLLTPAHTEIVSGDGNGRGQDGFFNQS